MPTSYTTLLGLAKPATGELSGTWGSTVNSYITEYLDSAVAGAQVISGSLTAVTLSTTNGSSLVQAGASASGSSQYAIIRCTGNPAGQLTVTVPATSKVYLVLNSTSTNQSVKIVGAGPTTGVTIAANRAALIAWNGSDFALVATTDVAQLSGFGTGVATALGQNVTGSGGIVLATSPALTTPNLGTPSAATLTNATGLPIDGGTTGTLPVNRGGTGATTLTGVIRGNGTSAFTTGNVSLTTEVTGTLPVANGGTGASDAGTARTNLGLGSIATQAANNVAITGGSISGITDLAVADGGTGASDAGTARTNLGLGSIATQAANNVSITGGSISGITDLAVADGGTGASDAGTARTNLDVPSRSGSGASGTWGINISGNAATVTNGITTSNIGSYAPGLTGSGASGTWGINISGNAATASNGGVTSVNSQTGAVVTTSLGSIGSVIWAAVDTASVLVPGDTVSGSNVYYPTSFTFSGDTYWTENSGSGSSSLLTYWATTAAQVQSAAIRVRSASGYSTPQGTVSTLSGTWRVMSPVPARVVSLIDGFYYSYTYYGLLTRVS